MTIFTGIAIYVVVWWIVLFTVLPFGVRRHEEKEAGLDPGAPARPLLWIKAGATTAIAAVIWLAIYLVIEFDVIQIRPT